MSCIRIGSRTNERIEKMADERRKIQMAAGGMFGENTTIEINL
jgi:hypothetical protein